jgi:prepilin peptidase CpaA
VAIALVHQLAFILFPLVLVFGAFSDLLTMTISNKLVLALVGSFLLLAPLAGMDWQTFGLHFAAGGIILAVTFFLFAMGWFGGGDAKLAAAIALWLGWDHTLSFVAYTSIFGGVLTLTMIAFRRSIVPAFIIRQPWIRRLHDEKAGVPYAVALAAAGIALYPDTIWMNMAIG